jgi:hypothetical protein
MPARVVCTPLLLRTSSCHTQLAFERAIVCDSAGWLTCSRRAAAETLPSSATATNASSLAGVRNVWLRPVAPPDVK